jgi:hypothetical protein
MTNISDEALEAAVRQSQQRSGVTLFLFNMARECCELTDTLDAAAVAFAVATKKAEAQLKRKLGVSNLKHAFPFWCVHKSDLMKAFRLGIDPRNYASGSAVRGDVQRVRKVVARQADPFADPFGDAFAGIFN